MKKTISVATFRRATKIEDAMIRASMPKTNLLDPASTTFPQERSAVVASSGGTRLARRSVAALTYTLAEVSNA